MITVIVCMFVSLVTVSNAASSMSGSVNARVDSGTDYYVNSYAVSGTRYCRIEVSNINQSSGGVNLYNEVSDSSICVISTTMHSAGSYMARYSLKSSHVLTYRVANLTPNSYCKANFSWNYNN